MTGTSAQGGFSLVEACIALLLFSLGTLGLIHLQTTSLWANGQSLLRTEATAAARSKIEELIAADYEDARLLDRNGNGAAGLDDDTAPSADHSAPGAGPLGHLLWNVAKDRPLTGMKQIRVIAHWNDKGRTRRVALDYFKAPGR